jgi:zinc protease
MEADRMVNSFISRADLDKEMTVVRKMEIGETIRCGCCSSRCTRRPIAGTTTQGADRRAQRCGRVGIENLQAFYRRYYQPDNAVLVAGQFDRRERCRRSSRRSGRFRAPRARAADRAHRGTAAGRRPRTDADAPRRQQHRGRDVNVAPGAHPDTTALALLTVILADTPGGRLERAGRHAQGRMADVDVRRDEGSRRDPVRGRTGKDRPIEPVRAALLAEIEGWPQASHRKNRARVRMRNAYEKILNDPARYGVALSESIAGRLAPALYRARPRGNHHAGRRTARGGELPPDEPHGRRVPARRQTPACGHSAVARRGRAGTRLRRKAVAQAVPTFDPSPANIDAHTVRQTLPNGMELALLSKPTRRSGSMARWSCIWAIPSRCKGKQRLAR